MTANESGLPHGGAGMLTLGGAAGAGTGGLAGSPIAVAGTTSLAGAFAQSGASASAGTAGAATQVNVGGAPGAGSAGRAGTSGSASIGGSSNGAGSSNAGSANAGGSGGATGSSAAFAKVSTILGNNCGIKGCHADKQSPHFVPGPMLYTTLVGMNTVLAECDYTKLVEPGDPAKSALVRLMNRQCGSFTMPPSCTKTPCLAAADLQTLSDWIQAGAPQ